MQKLLDIPLTKISMYEIKFVKNHCIRSENFKETFPQIRKSELSQSKIKNYLMH